MSGHTSEQDKSDNLHPEEILLLAYIRRQLTADASHEVYQHLANCESCRFKYATLVLQSGLAYAMPAYSSIVDMLGERIDNPAAAQLALQQRRRTALQQDIALGRAVVLFFLSKILPEQVQRKIGTVGRAVALFFLSKVLRFQRQNAKKPTSTTIAIRSVPLVGIAALIFSILLVVAFVLASTLSNHRFVPGGSSNSSKPATEATRNQFVIPSKPTATSTQAGIAPGPGTTGKGTQTGPDRTFGKVCSTPAEVARSQLHICGYNFKPGDKVVLLGMVVFSIKEKSEIIADAHGSFSVVWTITNCHSAPGYIIMQDQTHHSIMSFIPVTVTIGTCHVPNKKPQPGPMPIRAS